MPEERSSDNYVSEPNTNSTDELAEVFALARGESEVTIIKILRRILIRPILTPLIRQAVKEEFGLAQQEQLRISTEENPANNSSSSVPKKLKLQFRNKISLPVFTGKRILGENETAMEIALVDALTDQIVNTGPESRATVEIVGFRVGDNDKDDDDDDIWTFEDFQSLILKEKKGKRILQGNTCVQLEEGVCFIGKLSFTHNSVNTKNGWYRLGAGVVDAALMNGVKVARTEAFLMKDARTTYSEKHDHPSLADKVCHLRQISYKGRYKHLKLAGVNTVKDFLICIYKDPKRLKDILKLGASSKTWDDIVNHAQMSNGMFLWLDPSNERKTGIVLNVKLQLKGLIVEPHEYIPVDQLSDKQKVDNQDLVKFASKHLEILHSFEDETSLKEYLRLGTAFNQSFGTSKMTDGPSRPVSNMGQSMHQVPVVTSGSEKGKETAPFDNEMIYSTNYNPEHISFHAHDPTEPGSSCQAVESLPDTCDLINDILSKSLEELKEIYHNILSCDSNLHHDTVNSDTDVVIVAAAQNVCVCPNPGTRWIKVSKLLRRNSVRKRIGLPEGIQALKKQRCC